MHIELTEMLRCPAGHDEAFLVLATAVMKGRHVHSGVLGCPVCKAEIPVVKGTGLFSRESPGSGTLERPLPGAAALQALLGLSNAGGAVVLVGSACAVAKDLGDLLGGTHIIGVNPIGSVAASERVSLLVWDAGIPLKKNSARGVVLGAEATREPWLSEAARIVLKGQRVVGLGAKVDVKGLEPMAQSPEAWVGQKTAR